MLAGASIEDTETTTRDLEIEVVVAKITTRVGHLNDEFLASDWTACEDQRIASATPIRFSLTLNTMERRHTHAHIITVVLLTATVAAAKP